MWSLAPALKAAHGVWRRSSYSSNTRQSYIFSPSCHHNFVCKSKLCLRITLMSETCIVCLGDLGDGSSEGPALSLALATPTSLIQDCIEQPGLNDVVPAPTINPSFDDSELIAHLQPCGHNLHNECLTPWVERANSCPICRQSFHSVELSNRINGMSSCPFHKFSFGQF